MAGHLLFMRVLLRLTRLIDAHPSASATAGKPGIRLARVLEEFREASIKHVTAAHRTTVAINNSAIHISEGGGGIRTLLGLFNGASAYLNKAAPNLPLFVIHGHATRYLNTWPCTLAASKRVSPTSGIPPVNALKPAFVNSIGMKRTFSSSTSTNDTNTHTAEWDAKLAACKADVTDWFAKKKAEDAAFLRYVSILVGSWCLIFWGCFSMLDSGSSQRDTNSCEGKSGSHHQAAAGANGAVENPKV